MTDTADRPTALTDVRLLDGERLGPPVTVVLRGATIEAVGAAVPEGADVVDGAGATLLPGLVDAHVHLDDAAQLEAARAWGVTTMLDMADRPEVFDPLRGRPGLPDLRGAGWPASAPGGVQTTRMSFPAASALSGPEQAEPFVAARAAAGADHVKIIVEDPARMGPAALGRDTVEALVRAAGERGLLTVAHATTPAAIATAVAAGVSVLTHAPLVGAVDEATLARAAADGTVLVPTLTMMEAVAAAIAAGRIPGGPPPGAPPGVGPSLDNAVAAVAAFHAAGVPVLVGTDANAGGGPAAVPHGEAVHREMELLVRAGLSTTEVLAGATSLVADRLGAALGLSDRGEVRAGARADLLLVDGDPTADITATRAITAVWCAGQRWTPA